MTNRGTSVYSLQVMVPPDLPEDYALTLLHRAAESLALPLADQHTEPGAACIGLRVPDDEEAGNTAWDVISALGTVHWVSWKLTTGFGVHKRTVEHIPVVTSRPDGSYDGRCSCGAAVVVFTSRSGVQWMNDHLAGRIPAGTAGAQPGATP